MTVGNLPPGPRAPSLVQTIGWWNRSVPYLEGFRARYGSRFTLRLLGPPPFVVHSDPEHIKAIFTAPPEVLHPGEGAKVLEPIVGTHSVILLDEDSHMEQRKLMLPAFHGDRIARLEDLVREIAEREVDGWPRGETVVLHPRLQALTLEIILRAVFGLDRGERLDGLRANLAELLELGSGPIGLVPPNLNKYLGRFGPFARFAKLSEETDELMFALIEERRASHDGDDRDDILTMFLDAEHSDGSPMSPIELRDELMTLLVAGHETTASELAWALERLPRSPEVMDTLRSEIEAEDGDEYMTAVIRETLRRRPVLPFAAPRFVQQPVEIGGWSYEPGVCLVAGSYLVQHDPEIYPEPYAFRPERFLGVTPGTYTWIPFGGGRRRCLGATFAMLEMKVVLEAVLRRYSVSAGGSGPELTQRRSITVSPRKGTRVMLAEREPAVAISA